MSWIFQIVMLEKKFKSQSFKIQLLEELFYYSPKIVPNFIKYSWIYSGPVRTELGRLE